MAHKNRGVAYIPIRTPCHITSPIRSPRRAPWYWATNVLTYMVTPKGKQIMVQWSMPAGMAAAIPSAECHSKNIRSTNNINEKNPVKITSGKAIATTSRPPHSRVHQLFERFVASMPHHRVGGRRIGSRRVGKRAKSAR